MENSTEILDKIAQDFVSRLDLPKKKAACPFVVATIGLPGSGRTTVAKRIAEQINGAILVQSNSVRFLLKEAGLSWGENVRQVLKRAAKSLLSLGYGVIFDGNASDKEDCEIIYEIAKESEANVYYVRINIDPETAKEREKKKYEGTEWISSFENFRVNTTEKMLKNIDDRIELHKNLQSGQLQNLAGEIDNNGTLEKLYQQIDQIVNKIRP